MSNQVELEVSSVDALPFHGLSVSIGSLIFSQMVSKHAGLSQKISESHKRKLIPRQETSQLSGEASTNGASSSISASESCQPSLDVSSASNRLWSSDLSAWDAPVSPSSSSAVFSGGVSCSVPLRTERSQQERWSWNVKLNGEPLLLRQLSTLLLLH